MWPPSVSGPSVNKEKLYKHQQKNLEEAKSKLKNGVENGEFYTRNESPPSYDKL